MKKIYTNVPLMFVDVDMTNELGKIVSNVVTVITIKTPKGWKCKRKDCTMKALHTHSTYSALAQTTK